MVGERTEERDRLVRVEEQLRQAILNQDEGRERHHHMASEVQAIRIMMERHAQQQDHFLQTVTEQVKTTKQIAADIESLKITREITRRRIAAAQKLGLWGATVFGAMFAAGDHLTKWIGAAIGAIRQ